MIGNRVERATEDLRSTHRSLLRILREADDPEDAGDRARRLHDWMCEVSERALHALAAAAEPRKRQRSVVQRVGFEALALTWRVPSVCLPPRVRSGEAELPVEALEKTHGVLVARWIARLEEVPVARWDAFCVAHELYGDLDVGEWARLAAAVARAMESTGA